VVAATPVALKLWFSKLSTVRNRFLGQPLSKITSRPVFVPKISLLEPE
jgi:hypothetical protein